MKREELIWERGETHTIGRMVAQQYALILHTRRIISPPVGFGRRDQWCRDGCNGILRREEDRSLARRVIGLQGCSNAIGRVAAQQPLAAIVAEEVEQTLVLFSRVAVWWMIREEVMVEAVVPLTIFPLSYDAPRYVGVVSLDINNNVQSFRKITPRINQFLCIMWYTTQCIYKGSHT